jgi:hypothetical protein
MAAADSCGGSARAQLRLGNWIKRKEAGSGYLIKRQGMANPPESRGNRTRQPNFAPRIRVKLEAEEEDAVAWGPDVSGTRRRGHGCYGFMGRPPSTQEGERRGLARLAAQVDKEQQADLTGLQTAR